MGYQLTSNNPVCNNEDLNALCKGADDKSQGGHEGSTQGNLTNGESVQLPTHERPWNIETPTDKLLSLFGWFLLINSLQWVNSKECMSIGSW